MPKCARSVLSGAGRGCGTRLIGAAGNYGKAMMYSSGCRSFLKHPFKNLHLFTPNTVNSTILLEDNRNTDVLSDDIT